MRIMKNKNVKGLIQNLAPFLITFLFPIFFSNELFFTLIIILLIIISLKIEFEKNELILVIFGVLIGLIIEVITGMFYRMQYWDNGSLFGVPIWLPLIWGYGFLIIRRIGNIIIKLR